MAIPHLTEEQISTWSREQKDRWWLDNVYKGNMPQLTLRSGLLGFLLGGILSATGMYISARTGITVGVGLTSVILAFALFRTLSRSGAMKDLTVLENNCTQSVATAAGYVVAPLTSGMAAYMLVTDTVVPWWQLMSWMAIIPIIGVLLAFPLKRRFINDEQMPFPEGRACGVVLDSLYSGDAGEGEYKAHLLLRVALLAATFQAIVSDGWMRLVQFKLLMMDRWAGMTEPWVFHERLDQYYYSVAAKVDGFIPTIMGTDVRVLGLRLTWDFAMIGVGGLMGLVVAASCLLGSFVNFVVLAPMMIAAGDIAPRVLPSGATVPLSRAEIVNQWSMWWGVAMMVSGSLVGLLGRPELIKSAFTFLKGEPRDPGEVRASKGSDVLAHIELPLWISYVGIPIFSIVGCWLTHVYFGVPIWLSLLSLPLIFVLTVICTNSMALTSWTPTGALSKITQFTIGAIDRSNPASNLMPAAMTAEIASNAANLLSDIKPGYMLGGKPRHQAAGHVIGIMAGVIACVPIFFLLFLPPDANGVRHTSSIISETFSMPGAVQWRGVAEIIAGGLTKLPTSAIVAAVFAAAVAAVIELAKIATKGRLPLSSVSIGLGVVLPPESTFMMFVGALFFWLMSKRHKTEGSSGWRLWVDGCEPICAGLISGAALMGIGNAVINAVM